MLNIFPMGQKENAPGKSTGTCPGVCLSAEFEHPKYKVYQKQSEFGDISQHSLS